MARAARLVVRATSLLTVMAALAVHPAGAARAADVAPAAIRKVEDIVLYQDEKFYSAFTPVPSRRMRR